MRQGLSFQEFSRLLYEGLEPSTSEYLYEIYNSLKDGKIRMITPHRRSGVMAVWRLLHKSKRIAERLNVPLYYAEYLHYKHRRRRNLI